MKVEVMTEGTQLKGVTFSHVDSKQEQESVERILAHIFRGEDPVEATRRELDQAPETAKDEPQNGYDECLVRAFLAGYYVDENGLATDQKGRTIGEKIPGSYLREFKNRLALYDIVDEDGVAYLPIFEDGEEQGRIYATDDEEVRELITREIQKCQPINSLLAILTGMPTRNVFGRKDFIDWKLYGYTVGKGILRTRELSRVAFTGPLYVRAIMNRTVHDYEGWTLEVLRFLTEEIISKPTAQKFVYLMSDAEVGFIAEILNPQAWKTIFRSGSLEKTIETLNQARPKIEKMLDYVGAENQAWQAVKNSLDLWSKYRAEYPSLEIN